MPEISSITHSKNSKRKSHRVTIPIQVVIHNHTYTVLDWSMDGLRVSLEPKNFQDDLSIGDILEIKLILPTGHSSILLDMKVTIKNITSNMYGMHISKINDKNRRVLRHYATLAIDGNIDHVDNLSGDLFMNNVATPIKESILMSDKESKDVHKSFLKKLIINGTIGLIFLVIFVIVILYNYLIVKETAGFISGNSSIYFTPFDGVVKNIYVNKGDTVEKNQLLFEMEDREYKTQMTILKETQVMLQQQLKSYKNRLKAYQKDSSKKIQEMNLLAQSEIKHIKESLETQTQTYNRAKYLYSNQLLSFTQFSEIQSKYLQYRDDYNAIVNKKRSINQNSLALEQSYNKNQDHIISIQNSILSLSKNIEVNRLEIAVLKNYVDNATIISHSTGKVHNINRQKGEFLDYATNVLIIETEDKPFVLVKILSEEMSTIAINAPCIIKSERTGMIYTAKVTGIGYPAIDGINVGGNELSQNEVPLKVEFNDSSVRLHLNEYLQVYILNSSTFAGSLVKITTGISLND